MIFIYWRGANVSFVNQASCAGKSNIGRTSNKVCGGPNPSLRTQFPAAPKPPPPITKPARVRKANRRNSAFGGKADITIAREMSAFGPERTREANVRFRGVKRPYRFALQMSAYDLKRKFTSIAELLFNINHPVHPRFVMPRDEASIFECSPAAKHP